ncbi:related to ERF2-subunit of a palmitoyltransferase [Sporisorium scitamineum]|uniref:Related to ERF2-subunit of a palmitoyltransferase n=1 Tax=Sporisorium scitamineum TaxID=49012 RepID=A0A127Z8X0_9BASI|nr:related to ERF2-subunit of a palmitoyltransferase [Sporisorium scitamineum]
MSDSPGAESAAAGSRRSLSRPGSTEPPALSDTTPFPSWRTFNSSSRLSYYTEAATRRSSFVSAQASIYQDTEASLAFDGASQGFDHPDLDSDLEVRSQHRPTSRNSDRSRVVSPYQLAMARRSYSIDRDALETTLDDPSSSSSQTTGAASGGLARRLSSYKRQSADLARSISSLSRRSSLSGTTHEDPQHRLRDAATAAANRSSMSNRRHSVEIDQLTNSISRASTPHGFRTEDADDDDAVTSQPRSRPGSSLALRKYDENSGSFIKRDGTKDRGSILPPAAFFAPKKPSARNSSSHLLATAASPTASHAGRSTTPLSFYSASALAAPEATEQEILQSHGSLAPGHEQQGAVPPRAPGPWGLAPSPNSMADLGQQHLTSYTADSTDRRNSHTADGTAPLHPLDPSDGFPTPSVHASPHSVVRMMTSTDPLLPARAISNAATTTTTTTTNDNRNSNNSASSRNIGLGFDTGPASTEPKVPVTEQRAAPPSKTPPTSKAEQGRTQVNGAATTGTAAPSSAAAKRAKRGPRNYRNHKGDNRFFLGGLLMTSGDNPLPFILSYLLLLVLGGLFYGFEAAWLSTNISPAVIAIFAYIWLQAVVNMGVTAFRDPGVIPRNLDPDPPCVLGDTPFEPRRHALADPEDPMAIPVQRVLRIRNQVVKVKWCETCGTYRPPRSSHCRVCDNCVENIDHHCTYLNTCIGRRNYVSFMVFLATSIVSAMYVVAFTALRLVLLTKPVTYRYPRGAGSAPGLTFRQALAQSPVSAVLFLLCVAAAAPLLLLFTYHVRLVLLNRSTVEQIRINTAREYGEHNELELGTHGDADDTASTYGAAETNRGSRRSGAVRAMFERFGVLKPKYRDPNPFASRSTRVNVSNALGWRSVQLDSWIDRRRRQSTETRLAHPKGGVNGLEWKA